MTLKDIIKSAKRGKRYDLRCPSCKSKNIIKLHSLEWLMPPMYYCTECGYQGNILVEFEEN
ncbi:MAG: hypothetical protein RQ968_02085 [Thermoproteota archaeon]|jgi:predicted RNA-binding Zn-ribbon protein involved in translation (DUF1610 family)|nr:hypothetical protein [Thermoproteota archaeon]